MEKLQSNENSMVFDQNWLNNWMQQSDCDILPKTTIKKKKLFPYISIIFRKTIEKAKLFDTLI